MKNSIWLVVLFAVTVFATIALFQPASFLSGKVEQQIQTVSPQLAEALDANCTFDRTSRGYQPKPQAPEPPSGLKPQEQQAWTAFAVHHATGPALKMTFPKNYSAATEVHAAGMTVALTPRHSNEAAAQIENGKLVYHEIYPSTDSINVVSNDRSEEFLLLHDAQAPQRFEYDMSAISGVSKISLADNVIHFTNAGGQEMQIEAPWLVENGDQKVADAVHWELSYPNGDAHPRLALVVANATALHYPVVIDPTWTLATNTMTAAREFHTATLLTSGLVLVVGGINSTNAALATAELFNPATGVWSATGNVLSAARSHHTATLLQDSTVLIAGGEGAGNNALPNSAIYNPTSNHFTATANTLNTARYNHTATLLDSGKVLVVGGHGASGQVITSELYDPSTKMWTTSTGTLATARELHTATLTNGVVDVIGGLGASGVLATVEVYSPSSDSWSTLTNHLVTARQMHSATLLNDRTILIAGGENSSGAPTNSTEILNFISFSSTGSLNVARYSHTATLLPNGQVLVSGGTVSANSATIGAEIYDPTARAWSTSTSLNLSAHRTSQTATLLPSGGVLVAGGFDPASSTYFNSLELFTLGTGSSKTSASNMHTQHSSHTGTLLATGKVLVAGGLSGSETNIAETYDPSTDTWTQTGLMKTARWLHTGTLLLNGKVLVTGGLNSGAVTNTAEIYDPSAGTWSSASNMPTGLSSATATLLQNGKVLLAGGDDTSNRSTTTAEIYDPTANKWTTIKSMNTARSTHTATLLPNGQVLVAGGVDVSANSITSCELYDPILGTWTATGDLKAPRSAHTATLLPNGQILAVGGAASSRTSELYDPSTGVWTLAASLSNGRELATATLLFNGFVLVSGNSAAAEVYNTALGTWSVLGNDVTARISHTATLLPSGKVLLAGGVNGVNLITSEVFDPLGFTLPNSNLSVNSVSSANSATALSVSGGGFAGTQATQASSGGTNSSDTNIPIVQLHSLNNEEVLTLKLDNSQGFTDVAFNGFAPSSFVPGYTYLTVTVNGTTSTGQIIPYTGVAPIFNNTAPTSSATAGTAYSFTYNVSGYPTPTLAVTAGALPPGLTLTSAQQITGTPTKAGTFTGTVTASNGTTDTTQDFSITVYATYASWAASFNLTGTNALPTANPANDGIPNLIKYALGLNPHTVYNPGDTAHLPVVFEKTNPGNTFELAMTFDAAATDLTYTVQASSDLINWSTIDTVNKGAPPVGNTIALDTQLTSASPKRFLRLQVSQ